MTTTISFGKHSRIGERKNNEDAADIVTRPNAALLIVADGLGGHSGGEIASQTLIEIVKECFIKATNEQIQDYKSFFNYSISLAHIEIHKAAVAADKMQFDPKTTCVICIIYGDTASWCHVGDSRMYLLRDGMIVFHTTDHVAKGFKKNAPINRCVGGTEAPIPTMNEPLQLEEGDMLFLCTDGAWHTVKLGDLKTINFKNPQPSLEQLLEVLENRNPKPSDNVTAIAACFGSKK